MKTLEEAKIIARSSDPAWVGEELFRLQGVAQQALARVAELEAHQELYIKDLEVARSLTDPKVAEHFHKERYRLMGQLAVLKLLVRKLAKLPFATNEPLTDDEIRELLKAHGCDVQW